MKKPSPEFFRRLLGKYGLDPEERVMIGNDASSDIAGAKVMDGDFRKIEGLILRDRG